MLFNTGKFIIFFLVVLLIYWVLPNKVRNYWLLVASYYFYGQWNSKYCFLLLFVTLVTYCGALGIDRIRSKKNKKGVLILLSGLIICFGILGIYKYLNMSILLINKGLELANLRPISWTSSLILPVGISFFTLQAVGYFIDVYRGEIYAEKNIFKFALFISFYPQLVAGPIERSKNLLKQISVKKSFSYDNLRKGLALMVWGLFTKMVIADRAAIFVDNVYGNYGEYGGVFILVATVLFAIQIYCDFYGYSTIARGAAQTMGFSLMENFSAPYFSRSIKEFWHRWHISLSTWFRDYLYIPLGGNRKGKLRQQTNLMIVFAVSGLWHGASLGYVFWGLLNGFYQVFAAVIDPIKRKSSAFIKLKESRGGKIISTLITFVLTSFAWLFFRAGSFSTAAKMLGSMLSVRNYGCLLGGEIFNLGISKAYFAVLLVCIFVLLFVDYRKYKGRDVIKEFFEKKFWFRCLVEAALIFAILLFGCYGEMYDVSAFIYFQF